MSAGREFLEGLGCGKGFCPYPRVEPNTRLESLLLGGSLRHAYIYIGKRRIGRGGKLTVGRREGVRVP